MNNTALDPKSAHAAAARFGKLVSMNLLTVADVLPVILAAHPADQVDQMALKTRLTWSILDAALHWDMRRAAADKALRRALAPLFDAFTPPADILAAATLINTDAEDCLLSHEIRMAISDEATWFMKRYRRSCNSFLRANRTK